MKKTIALVLLGAVVSFVPCGAAEKVEFKQRERIAYVGNSLGARMGLFGHLETLLHARFPQQELVIRNFSWPADEVGIRQRPNDYTHLDDPLAVFGADTFICFFGYNESFAGAAGVEKFKEQYKKFVADTNEKYGKGKARFILISPIAFENVNDPLLPNGQKENENLRAYTAATAEVARELNAPFVDVFTETQKEFARETGAQFTINGCHINEAGDRLVGQLIDRALFGTANPLRAGAELFGRVRAAVNDKSWVHQQDYRMLNGWYVYGSRRAPYDVDTFPEEYKKIRAMTAVRDEFIWSLVQGKASSAGPDDSKTGELKVPKTAFGTKKYSEPAELRFLGGEEAVSAMTTAPGFKVSLFASEAEFPELAKPVQVNFDNKGRLWVACMPTYPQWKPGDPKPNDRLLIFEDTNSDGKADKVKVFYDELHCATSFEFWNGGVLVMSQPGTLFLKDTDGDDKADQVTHWLDGWASDDTHHRGGFEWSHGGLLHANEGVSMSTTLETPYGAFRNKNSPGSYVIDPRTLKIRHFVTPGYGNPWCYVFDTWGQGFVGDGTTAQQHWDTPLSGLEKGSRRGLNPVFDTGGMRPVIGSEFLWSRHLPEEVQGQFIYACVINMNGIPRWEIKDDSAGFKGKRLMPDLVKSTDKNFRPGDPKIGPDGAIWFIDWHNPLIGHMQYSQRDPNRDHTRGRVYRLTAEGRPLLKPVTQFGKSIPELLDQLKTYERRTRYAARRELWDRPKKEVLAAIDQWIAKQDTSDPEYDRLMAEALWVQEGHRAVTPKLVEKVLTSKTPEARAAAVRVVANEWDRVPGGMAVMKHAVADEHPRVRVEAVRALSYVPSLEAAELAASVTSKPMDYYLDYTLEHTLRALESEWKAPFEKGEFAKTNTPAHEFVAVVSHGRPELVPALRSLRALIQNPGMQGSAREDAMRTVARAKGRANAGKEVYARVCVSCHKVGDVGIDFGPNLSDVGRRMNREELAESILYPNLKVDPKYLTVNITTKDGEELSGVIEAEDDATVTLKLGAGNLQKIAKSNISKRETTKVSNMPEGLAESIQAEFVDLIEYLAAQKADAPAVKTN